MVILRRKLKRSLKKKVLFSHRLRKFFRSSMIPHKTSQNLQLCFPVLLLSKKPVPLQLCTESILLQDKHTCKNNQKMRFLVFFCTLCKKPSTKTTAAPEKPQLSSIRLEL